MVGCNRDVTVKNKVLKGYVLTPTNHVLCSTGKGYGVSVTVNNCVRSVSTARCKYDILHDVDSSTLGSTQILIAVVYVIVRSLVRACYRICSFLYLCLCKGRHSGCNSCFNFSNSACCLSARNVVRVVAGCRTDLVTCADSLTCVCASGDGHWVSRPSSYTCGCPLTRNLSNVSGVLYNGRSARLCRP